MPPSIWIFGFACGLGNVDIDHAVVITATNPITATVMILRMGHLLWISPHNAYSHRLYRERVNRFTHATSPYDGRRYVWQSGHTTALILYWLSAGSPAHRPRNGDASVCGDQAGAPGARAPLGRGAAEPDSGVA